MTPFTEKLGRLTDERVKRKLCRRAGLPLNTIGNLLTTGRMPRADVALRLAIVLEVDLSWLLDSEQGFPAVPASTKKATSAA